MHDLNKIVVDIDTFDSQFRTHANGFTVVLTTPPIAMEVVTMNYKVMYYAIIQTHDRTVQYSLSVCAQ